MHERRAGRRLLCADLITVEWDAQNAEGLRLLANLEDISAKGACLELDRPIPPGNMVKVICPDCQFRAKVRHCAFRTLGYYVGVHFAPGEEWSLEKFSPRHLLDPAELLKLQAIANESGPGAIHRLAADVLARLRSARPQRSRS